MAVITETNTLARMRVTPGPARFRHAVLTDPMVQARLSLDEAWQLADDLVAAEAEWLPGWLGGSAPDWLD